MSERTIKLSLLENSHSFLKESVANALSAGTDPHRWQFAILHLVQALELSLKAALHRIHPILVFDNIDNVKNTNTVSLRQAMIRLQDPRIGGKAFSPQDTLKVEDALKVRNQVTHSNFELTYGHAAAKFFALYPFVVNFQKYHLVANIQEVIDRESMKRLLGVKRALNELLNAARARIKERGVESRFIHVCPNCEQETFVLTADEESCYTCLTTSPVGQCPMCDERVLDAYMELVDPYADEENGRRACLNCLEVIRDEREAASWEWELASWEELAERENEEWP